MKEKPGFSGRRALAWAAGELAKEEQDKEAAAGEARALLSFFTERSGLDFLLTLDEELDPAAERAFRQGVARRRAGEPMQYILGSQLFMERELLTRPGVLIPRWDTEILVRAALARLKERASGEKAAEPSRAAEPDQAAETPRVLELGVGSGAIIGSLAAELPGLTGVAVDLAPEPLALAADNFRLLGVAERLELRQGSWYEPVPETERFDAIVSNPPYITTTEMADLDPSVLAEPRLALWGGEDGLDCYREIVPGAWRRLADRGWLLVEIGWRQGPAVAELFRRAGFRGVEILPDRGGRDRVALGQKVGGERGCKAGG